MRQSEKLHFLAPGVSPADCARILSNSDSGASSTLHTRPTKRALILSRHQCLTYLALRHGTLYDGSRKCVCGKPLTNGHVLGCKRLSSRIWRHDLIVQVVYDYIRKMGIAARKEVMINPSKDWRVDVLAHIDGVTYWLDVNITEPSSPSFLAMGSGARPGVAARFAEKRKFSQWNRRSPGPDVKILPLVMETSGRLGGHFKKFLKLVAESAESKHRTANRKCGFPLGGLLGSSPRPARAR